MTPEQVKGLRGVRPAGPSPRPSAELVRVQRRASNTGVIMVVGQKIALGRIHKHQTVTVLVSETTLAVELDDGDVRVIRPWAGLAFARSFAITWEAGLALVELSVMEQRYRAVLEVEAGYPVTAPAARCPLPAMGCHARACLLGCATAVAALRH